MIAYIIFSYIVMFLFCVHWIVVGNNEYRKLKIFVFAPITLPLLLWEIW